MQSRAVIYLTAPPPQPSASPSPGLTVLDAIPERSLSSPWQGQQSPAPGEEFWHIGRGLALFKGGSARRREGLVVTEPFPCTAQTTAQICSRREGGTGTEQNKPWHCPGFHPEEFGAFSRQIGPFIRFAVNSNSLKLHFQDQ